ncbi:unnamed protein product [Durusdinium trenchii]|uniref:Uncharacterized protein n=1 Tax=Durusdinium trenchii TaxID=1381693 RepID=A0ABP0LW50_9DINO
MGHCEGQKDRVDLQLLCSCRTPMRSWAAKCRANPTTKAVSLLSCASFASIRCMLAMLLVDAAIMQACDSTKGTQSREYFCAKCPSRRSVVEKFLKFVEGHAGAEHLEADKFISEGHIEVNHFAGCA